LCLLEDADEIYVTADSISMLSDAIFTGKPVGMIPVRHSPWGAFAHGLADIGLRRPPTPNFIPVWDELKNAGLVGTIDAPRAGEGVEPPARIAADAVRALLLD
jgi:uncharacterized protein